MLIKLVFERISGRLVHKLVLLFTFIIILVVGSITFISYKMMQRQSVDNSIASTSNNLLLVNKNMEEYLKGMEKLSLPQIRYDEITYAILHESEDYASMMYLQNYLRDLFYSRSDLEAIYLYVVSKHKYYSVTKEDYNITVRIGSDYTIPSLSWYKDVMGNPLNRAYQSFVNQDKAAGYPIDQTNSFMAYHRVLRSIVTRQPQAMLSFYFNQTGRDEILKDIPIEQGQHLMFLSPESEPYYTDSISFYKKAKAAGFMDKLKENTTDSFTWSADGKKYLVIHETGNHEGWELVKPIPYTLLYDAANKTRDISFLIGFLFLLFAVFLVSYLSTAITKPLKRLAQQMNRFSLGDFTVETSVIGHDEIAYLSKHFNQMVRRTNDLINERYKMRLVEKNAILKALEAEINPHFLYNALQAISTKALKHERYDIADMVDALALTLRYCISGKEMVQARLELKHIGNYLSLQQARFGNRMNVVYAWDESQMELEIPKLSVQTLVENAIKHGVEKVTGTVTIKISAQVNESYTIISVSDNGPGFTRERLEQVRQSFYHNWEDRESEGESIGLVNLNTRLKLLYGEKAEFVIQSDSTGTEVRMLLPRGDASDVQSAHM